MSLVSLGDQWIPQLILRINTRKFQVAMQSRPTVFSTIYIALFICTILCSSFTRCLQRRKEILTHYTYTALSSGGRKRPEEEGGNGKRLCYVYIPLVPFSGTEWSVSVSNMPLPSPVYSKMTYSRTTDRGHLEKRKKPYTRDRSSIPIILLTELGSN